MGTKRMVFGERRLYARKACMFTVGVNDDRRTYNCHLRDLSVGGALLEHPSSFKPVLGQELVLKISYRNKSGAVEIKGRVVRFERSQIAVEFDKSIASTLHYAA